MRSPPPPPQPHPSRLASVMRLRRAAHSEFLSGAARPTEPGRSGSRPSVERVHAFGSGSGLPKDTPVWRCGYDGGETGSTWCEKECLLFGMIPPLSGHQCSCKRQQRYGNAPRRLRAARNFRTKSPWLAPWGGAWSHLATERDHLIPADPERIRILPMKD